MQKKSIIQRCENCRPRARLFFQIQVLK
uniref:Uncharacterized protein n=1 Tax=Arundo donax TaxID=35708 RepID=A0A0A9GLD5_ARUDO